MPPRPGGLCETAMSLMPPWPGGLSETAMSVKVSNDQNAKNNTISKGTDGK